MNELFHNILDTHNDDDMPPEAIFFRNLCARMRFCNGNPTVSVCKIKKNRLRRALECYDHSWTNYLLTKKRCPHLFMDQISVARSRGRARFTPRKKSISDNLTVFMDYGQWKLGRLRFESPTGKQPHLTDRTFQIQNESRV